MDIPLRLPQTLAAIDSPHLAQTLLAELQQQAGCLPLQQALCHSSHALDDDLALILQAIDDQPDQVVLHLGVLFHGLIAGCNCADEPGSDERIPEYAPVEIRITKQDGAAQVRLLDS